MDDSIKKIEKKILNIKFLKSLSWESREEGYIRAKVGSGGRIEYYIKIRGSQLPIKVFLYTVLYYDNENSKTFYLYFNNEIWRTSLGQEIQHLYNNVVNEEAKKEEQEEERLRQGFLSFLCVKGKEEKRRYRATRKRVRKILGEKK